MPTTTPLRLAWPGSGGWLVRNSPANRVPSHGTEAFATARSIDLVPVDERGRSGRYTLRSFVAPEPPERFAGYGRTLLAPAAGEVVAVHDGEPDHVAYRGLPSLGYALGQASRVCDGWASLAGNHVVIRAAEDAYVAVCHLQQGSVAVRVGDHVAARAPIGRCGSSGNSTEPHVHLQVMTAPDPTCAWPLPFTLDGALPRNGVLVRA